MRNKAAGQIPRVNTAERIVESYFRHCRGCLTVPDVKIARGNNRQIDLLAWQPKEQTAFHVESSVVPSGKYFKKSGAWKPLVAILQNKFFAQPKERQIADFVPPHDDPEYAKIQATYELYNFSPTTIRRVWVCWDLGDYGVNLDEVRSYFSARRVSSDLVEVISFRDDVIPALEKQIGSSNYEDDVLRTFSFFAERDAQISK